MSKKPSKIKAELRFWCPRRAEKMDTMMENVNNIHWEYGAHDGKCQHWAVTYETSQIDVPL